MRYKFIYIKANEGNATYRGYTYTFISGYLNLQPIRNLYLHCSNLGGYNSIGLYGCRTIVKVIPVTADFNYMVIDNVFSGDDYIDCSRVTLKQLEFRLTNEDGKTVPLHGGNISFSLVFDIMDVKS